MEVKVEGEVETESCPCCTRILYPLFDCMYVCMCKCIIQLFFVCLNRIAYCSVFLLISMVYEYERRKAKVSKNQSTKLSINQLTKVSINSI